MYGYTKIKSPKNSNNRIKQQWNSLRLHCFCHSLLLLAAKSLQSCPTLCNPIDGSPPGPAVPGILHARTLEWGAIAFSLYTYTHIHICVCAQSYPTLWPQGLYPPGSSLHGIFQARILKQVAISLSMGWIFLTQGLNPCLVSSALAGGFFTTVPPGKHIYI